MWINIEQAAELLNVAVSKLEKCATRRPAKVGYEILVSSLPDKYAEKLRSAAPPADSPSALTATHSAVTAEQAAPVPSASVWGGDTATFIIDCDDDFPEAYERAPNYNKVMFNKYYPIVLACEKLSGKAIEKYVKDYNERHPGNVVTIKTVYRKLKLYKERGRIGLLGNYGKTRGRSSVLDAAYQVFESVYLKNSGATISMARKAAVGFAIKHGFSAEEANRSAAAFKRRLDNTRHKGAQVLARHGYSAYNRTHEPFIRRDDRDMLAGVEWVTDHFKLDTYCIVEGVSKPVRPWVTWYMDNKSYMAVSWYIHPFDATTDDVFLAIRPGIMAYGKPQSLQMDNGADYVSKAFSGGRKNDTRAVELSFLERIGIEPHFGEVKRAQTKRIERTHHDINRWFSATLAGYCGSNTVNRPEDVLQKFKRGEVETFEEVRAKFDVFMRDVYNKLARTGSLEGKSPEEVWAAEYPIARERGLIHAVNADELEILCYRKSKIMQVRRAEIYDSENHTSYKGDLLHLYEGRKVYLRRDQANNDMEHALVYDANTDEFLCEASLMLRVSLRAKSEEERHLLGVALAQNKGIINTVKNSITNIETFEADEIIDGMATYAAIVDGGGVARLPAAKNTMGVTMITSAGRDIAKVKKQRSEVINYPDIDDIDALNAAAARAVPEKELLGWFDDDPEELLVSVG